MLLMPPGLHKCQGFWCVSYTVLQRKNVDKRKKPTFIYLNIFLKKPDIVRAPFFLR